MAEKDKKKQNEKSKINSCCYRVIDSCGCVIGSYCCDSQDMSNCRFEKYC